MPRSTEPGHKDTWGAPAKGWPSFGPDGKVVRPCDWPNCTCEEACPTLLAMSPPDTLYLIHNNMVYFDDAGDGWLDLGGEA